MTQKATVLRTNNFLALVVVHRNLACGEQCVTCATGCSGKKNHWVWVKNPVGAAVGDTVLLYASDSSVLWAAASLYLFPLLLFFISYGVSYAISGSKILAAFVAAILFVIGFLSLHLFDKKLAPTPTVIKILDAAIRKDEPHGI